MHQWVTFAVNGAGADGLCRDGAPRSRVRRRHGVLPGPARLGSWSLVEGSRFRPLACRGTFFQMLDYSAITDERDADFAMRLTREHGVAAIPISPFLQRRGAAGPVLRFCFAKRDETLERAAERLCRV